MRSDRRRAWGKVAAVLLVIAGALAAAAPAARAEYPERPITMIVPWAPGGSTDLTGRALAQAAEKILGQPIVIVNKPGAATMLGMTELAGAKPDGYTVGTLSSTTYMHPLRGRQVSYDSLKSFTYISYYGDNLIGIAVLADSKWKTLKDLVADGKANPARLKYGNAGVGTTQHLTTEKIQLDSGAKFTFVPQKGSAEAVAALLGGHLDFITEVSVWAPHVEAGKVRLLAVTTPKRAEGFPEVPTVFELGFESLRSVQAIIGPAGIPEPIRAKLEDAFRKGMADPGFVAVMKKLHMVVVDGTGEYARKAVETEIGRAKALIDTLGIK
jgi:tripartite-type tricarboxylate transporter receptor subunit TctC